MRLNEELIKQAILHSDQEVRSEAILYFSRSNTSDDSILPLAIQAIEQYGWDKAFDVAAEITGLPLNDTTLLWVLAQLQQEDAKKPDEFGWTARWYTLNSLLSDADAELLTRHKQAILDVDGLDAETIKIVRERIDLLTAGGEFCWEELEKFCVESKDINEIGQVDLDHAYALCEAIGREKEKYAEKILTILGEKIENFESNPKVWMETFAVRIAGEMRLETAIPLLIGKSKEDGEWLGEQCETALTKIGGDAAISAAAEMFRQGDWHLRMAACNVFQHVHSDLAVRTALELLPTEQDRTIRAFLAGGLADHFAFEAIEPLRQLVLDGTYDETYTDLKRDVVIAATLMGIEFPEREQWIIEVERKRLESLNKRLKQRYQDLQEEVHRLKADKNNLERQKRRLISRQDEQHESEEEEPLPKRIGRNDPCPCGSGKKFKKCCLGKQRSSSDLI